MITIEEAIERERRNVAELLEILDKAEKDGKKLSPKAVEIFDELIASIGETGKVIKQRLDELIAGDSVINLGVIPAKLHISPGELLLIDLDLR